MWESGSNFKRENNNDVFGSKVKHWFLLKHLKNISFLRIQAYVSWEARPVAGFKFALNVAVNKKFPIN